MKAINFKTTEYTPPISSFALLTDFHKLSQEISKTKNIKDASTVLKRFGFSIDAKLYKDYPYPFVGVRKGVNPNFIETVVIQETRSDGFKARIVTEFFWKQ